MKTKLIILKTLISLGFLINLKVSASGWNNGNPTAPHCIHVLHKKDANGNETGEVLTKDLGTFEPNGHACADKVEADEVHFRNFSHRCEAQVSGGGIGIGPYD